MVAYNRSADKVVAAIRELSTLMRDSFYAWPDLYDVLLRMNGIGLDTQYTQSGQFRGCRGKTSYVMTHQGCQSVAITLYSKEMFVAWHELAHAMEIQGGYCIGRDSLIDEYVANLFAAAVMAKFERDLTINELHELIDCYSDGVAATAFFRVRALISQVNHCINWSVSKRQLTPYRKKRRTQPSEHDKAFVKEPISVWGSFVDWSARIPEPSRRFFAVLITTVVSAIAMIIFVMLIV